MAEVSVLKVVRDKGANVYLISDRTIFHPKGGGQPSDRGIVHSAEYQVALKKAIYYKGIVVLWTKIVRGVPVEGNATCQLDWEYRHLVMRRHTAAHLLDHCLAKTIDRRVRTTDSWLDEPCYVGYVGEPPSDKELKSTESLANRMIRSGGIVRIQILKPEEAKLLLQEAPNYERLPDLEEIRTVTIEGCDSIPCGGTHVGNIKEIGEISVSHAERISNDSYRLHFSVAGGDGASSA